MNDSETTVPSIHKAAAPQRKADLYCSETVPFFAMLALITSDCGSMWFIYQAVLGRLRAVVDRMGRGGGTVHLFGSVRTLVRGLLLSWRLRQRRVALCLPSRRLRHSITRERQAFLALRQRISSLIRRLAVSRRPTCSGARLRTWT